MSTISEMRSIDLIRIGDLSTAESWLISDWTAGQTTNMQWGPENVRINEDGTVEFLLTASADSANRPYSGSEVQSCDASSFGTWTWTTQAPRMVDGAVFGMFAYRADHFNDPWIEFDFEFVGADTTQVRLNIHMETPAGEHVTLEQGRNQQPIIVDLGFDASLGLHTYNIVVTEAAAHFLVDGKVVGNFSAADMPHGTWTTGEMKGFANLWSVDASLSSWAGEWVYPGTPLRATVAAIDVRPGDFGTFGPMAAAIYPEGSDVLAGTGSDDIIHGPDGNDTIAGHGGADVPVAGGSADAPGGGADNKPLGGEGGSILHDVAGSDVIDGGAGVEPTRVAEPVAVMTDLEEPKAKSTKHGSDTLCYSAGMEGSSGAGTLSGDDAANMLVGGNGNDLIRGFGGSDTIVGGMGLDILHGGLDRDRDTFVFRNVAESGVGKNSDVIHDFASGLDTIDLGGFDPRQDLAGDQALAFTGTTPAAYSVWYVVGRSEIVVRADVNGDKRADFELRLSGETYLSAEDFSL